jgi:uncharacterized protein (DUF488 family)
MTIFTIGHSNHSLERFVALLRVANVAAVADVRTYPSSRRYPHFNRERLAGELRLNGVTYVFLGNELGGRPSKREFYCDGVADYEKMAQSPEFKEGLERVIAGANQYCLALMCSERDPLDCHRCLLVSRALAQRGIRVSHILADGSLASHGEIEERLLELSRRNTGDLFAPRSEQLAIAYRRRARKVAFARPEPGSGRPIKAGYKV